MDTFPYFPLDVTASESSAGFQEYVLNLGAISCIPTQKCRVVARMLSASDVVIKWKGIRKGQPHVFYQHIRFGYKSFIFRFHWPLSAPKWHNLRFSIYESPVADFSRTPKSHVIGQPFYSYEKEA